MIALLAHEVRYGIKSAGSPFTALAVFLLALVLFPLLLGPEGDLLQRVGPGLMWLMAGLSSLLYAPLLIQEDIDDGTLAQLLLAPTSPTLLFLTKVTAQFMLVGLPLIALSLLSAPLYGLSMSQSEVLCLTFILGLPGMSVLCLLGSYLCAGSRGGNLLIMLLIFPLMIPFFIFALSAMDASVLNLPMAPHLYLLAAVSLLALVVGTSAGQYLIKFLA